MLLAYESKSQILTETGFPLSSVFFLLFFPSKFALKQLVPHPKRVLELTSGFLKISSGYGVIRHSKGSTTPNRSMSCLKRKIQIAKIQIGFQGKS